MKIKVKRKNEKFFKSRKMVVEDIGSFRTERKLVASDDSRAINLNRYEMIYVERFSRNIQDRIVHYLTEFEKANSAAKYENMLSELEFVLAFVYRSDSIWDHIIWQSGKKRVTDCRKEILARTYTFVHELTPQSITQTHRTSVAENYHMSTRESFVEAWCSCEIHQLKKRLILNDVYNLVSEYKVPFSFVYLAFYELMFELKMEKQFTDCMLDAQTMLLHSIREHTLNQEILREFEMLPARISAEPNFSAFEILEPIINCHE